MCEWVLLEGTHDDTMSFPGFVWSIDTKFLFEMILGHILKSVPNSCPILVNPPWECVNLFWHPLSLNRSLNDLHRNTVLSSIAI